MRKFWELMEKSIIIQGIVTVIIVGTVCYLVTTGKEVPSELWAWGGLILGGLFGLKLASIAK